MRAHFLRLGFILMLVALAKISGGHWLLLQSVAWTKMLATHSSQSQFSEALSKTFDGQHPCDLCQIIAKVKNQEPKTSIEKLQPQPVSLPKIDEWAIHRFSTDHEFFLTSFSAESRFQSPPVPPPSFQTV